MTDPSRKQLQHRLGGIAGHVPAEWPVNFTGIRNSYRYVANSGRKLFRSFCPVCVARIVEDRLEGPCKVQLVVGKLLAPVSFSVPSEAVFRRRAATLHQ